MQYLENKLRIKRLFNKEAKLPTTPEECKSWFVSLSCDLSPENLCCDREASREEVQRKMKSIKEAWSYLENIFGRKVSEEETWSWC